MHTRLSILRLILGLLLCASPSGVHADTRIVLREQAAPIEAEQVSFSGSGVSYRHSSGSGVIAWDRVLEITGDASADAAAWMTVADRAFRARVRIQRGDWRSAEPLLEELVPKMPSPPVGPTAAVVFEGLMRCRVQRGAHVAAVMPWLTWTRAQDAHDIGVTIAEFPASDGTPRASTNGTPSTWIGGDIAPTAIAPAAIDAGTRLCPALPPVWLADAGTRSIAESTEWEAITSTDSPANMPRGAALAVWYHAGLQRACGIGVPLPTTPMYDPGVRLVADIVTARCGEGEARHAARESLRQRLAAVSVEAGSKLPRWMEAWCRAGLGGSLLREDSIDSRRQGVAHLLHVPARFGNEQPYLAGVCLAEAAAALDSMGDATGAATLRDELARRYPGHSALTWRGPSPTLNVASTNETSPPQESSE